MDKIKKKFKKIKINSLAKEKQFMMRKPKKITPYNLIYSFYLTMANRKFSLRNWAIEFEKLTGQSISAQSIDKRLQIRQIVFYKALFEKAMKTTYTKYYSKIDNVLKPFNRVLIEDSTCIKLANKLYNHFSGASNGKVKKAITRIQFSFDLKSNTYENLEMCTYTRNDGAYSNNVLQRAKRGDLLIRDLGYWSLKVFKQLLDEGVYVLSRYKLNVKVFNTLKAELDLYKYLKNLDAKGITEFDMNVLLGINIYLPIRIAGRKLSMSQTKQKIQTAKRNSHKNQKISKKAKYLMSWNIAITNVEKDIWSIEDIFKVYRFRWKIELIFKNWKSTFNIDKLLQTSKSENPYRPEALLYLALTYMAIVFQPNFNYYRSKINSIYNKCLSPIKFGQYVLRELQNIFDFEENYLLDFLQRHCCYDKRKDRKNIYEVIY